MTTKSPFFAARERLWVSDIATIAGLPAPAENFEVVGVGPLETAGPNQLAYMDNQKYLTALAGTAAGVCLISPRFSARLPATTLGLVVGSPHLSYSKVLARLYPEALSPRSNYGCGEVHASAVVHPTAHLAEGVTIDPGAVVGPRACIGANTTIGANVVVGPHVVVGRDCSIGAGATITNATLGERVILHPGVRIGQDGFGYVMSGGEHLKIPQIGAVIIEDDVEIGANSTIDRGANRDTVIGAGTKIDNQVQIAHNVVIGRHCVIVSQVGVAGSTTLGDYVALGGHSAIAGHLTIGDRAQIAAASGVMHDVPAGERWGGTPARRTIDFFRQYKTVEALALRRPHIAKPGEA